MPQPILLCYSGGKDSVMTLFELQQNPQYEIAALVTTVADGYERISHHGVRRELLREQAAALGLPLCEVAVSMNCTNREYERKMAEALLAYRDRGIDTMAFGDIFLQDLREYRERQLAQLGMQGLFPIWKRDTTALVHEFLEHGFRTITVCVDGRVLDESFAGRELDRAFLAELPEGVDPCGENGEFHTFVFAGPPFAAPVEFEIGETVRRDERWFCDLVPRGAGFQPAGSKPAVTC